METYDDQTVIHVSRASNENLRILAESDSDIVSVFYRDDDFDAMPITEVTVPSRTPRMSLDASMNFSVLSPRKTERDLSAAALGTGMK